MELSDWSDVLMDNVDFFFSLIFVWGLLSSALELDTECRLSQYQEDMESICGLLSLGLFCLGTLDHMVSDSLDVWFHFWGWGMDRVDDKEVGLAIVGSFGSMFCWACLVVFACAMMACMFMGTYFVFGSDSMFLTLVIPFCLFCWEMVMLAVLLGIWKFGSPTPGMSAILKVPILGGCVNRFRSKENRRAVKKWREDALAKEWKCMFVDFPGCCLSFFDMFFFGAKRMGSWLVLFKGVIKIGYVIVGFFRKVGKEVGKAVSEHQQGDRE
mmetsp:Transcript_42848/g.79877  ORF Transcript_42848/g.79877 Transcript_42848/m.79877 type:complete len:269 (-) Transcript_42848:129-935(-)